MKVSLNGNCQAYSIVVSRVICFQYIVLTYLD